MTTQSTVPTELIAGDTWEWEQSAALYPAPTWVATWYFEKADANFKIDGTAAGSAHAAAMSAASSAAIAAGQYRWRMMVASAGVRKTAAEGWVDVQPDPAAAGNVDHRSTARKIVEMIDAYMADETNLSAASFALNGRSLARWDRAALLKERSFWASQIAAEEKAERLAQGLNTRNTVRVRFT